MIKKIKNNSYYFFIIIIFFIFLLFVDENGPLYEFSNYSDVCVFYEIGKKIVHGCEMYVDFVDVKGPYMYFIGALSFIINKSFIAFFLFDLLSFILFAIFSFKIFKLYFDELKSFLYTVLSLFISLYFLEWMGNPETIFLGFFSLFLYWILSGGFNRNNKFIFVIFGIIFSFIFLTKLIYLIPFFIISLLYIYFNRKNFKKIIFEIGFFFIGIIIGFIPLFIYEPNVLNMFEIISRYLLIAKNYSLDVFFKFDKAIFLKFLFPLVIFVISFLYLGLYKYTKEVITCFIYFLGFLIVVFIGKKHYFYYFYFFISFVPFLFIFFDKIFFKQVYLKHLLYIFLVLFLSLSFFDLLITKNFGLSIENDYQYIIYNDFKESINNDSVILNLSNIDNLITKYFDYQPNYKYFNTFNLPYEGFEFIYDEILQKVKNKEFDYISVFFKIKNSTKEKNYVLVSEGIFKEKEYLKEISLEIQENYKEVKTYYIENEFYRKDIYICIFEKK